MAQEYNIHTRKACSLRCCQFFNSTIRHFLSLLKVSACLIAWPIILRILSIYFYLLPCKALGAKEHIIDNPIRITRIALIAGFLPQEYECMFTLCHISYLCDAPKLNMWIAIFQHLFFQKKVFRCIAFCILKYRYAIFDILKVAYILNRAHSFALIRKCRL